MIVSKKVWGDILSVLSKHQIPYTTHFESSDFENLHVNINVVVKDYYDDDDDEKERL